MTIRYSTALRDYLQEVGCFKSAFQNGVLLLYSGTQPTGGDAAATGSLLATISSASGAVTSEVQSAGSVALTGGGAGSVNTLTVNSLEIMGSATNFNTSLIQTATDIVNKINNNPKNWSIVASNVGGTSATITLKAKVGYGTLPNGWVVASTVTTITKTDTNLSGGVDAINGLRFGDSISGTLVKDSTQTWSGVGTAAAGTGTTAGWFRLCGSLADAQAVDSAGAFLRLDGSVATSGADMNVTATTIVLSAPFVINTFSPTEPGTA